MSRYTKLLVLTMYLLSTAGVCAQEPVPLHGTVKVTMLQVEEALSQMETLDAKIMKDSQALAYQLVRQNIQNAVSPNFVGSSATQIILPPAPMPDGSIRMGDLKPISKPVFHKLLTDLREQVVEMRNRVIILNEWPLGLDKEVAEPWMQTTVAIDDMVNSCNRLIEAWKNDKSSRTALAKELRSIHKRSEQLDKQLDKIASIVKGYDRTRSAELAGSTDRK